MVTLKATAHIFLDVSNVLEIISKPRDKSHKSPAIYALCNCNNFSTIKDVLFIK